MIFKPSLFDIKYDKMESNERLFNYERDMMLYEQATALEQLAKNTAPAQNNTTNIDPWSKIQLDVLTNHNHFEYGSPEYIEFNSLKDKCIEKINASNTLNNLKSLCVAGILVSISFGIPLSFTEAPDILKIIGIALLPISLIGIIMLKTILKNYYRDIKTDSENLAKYTYEHTKNKEE